MLKRESSRARVNADRTENRSRRANPRPKNGVRSRCSCFYAVSRDIFIAIMWRTHHYRLTFGLSIKAQKSNASIGRATESPTSNPPLHGRPRMGPFGLG